MMSFIYRVFLTAKRSRAVGDFYGTGIEIWAGLATFEAGFFMFSWAKKI